MVFSAPFDLAENPEAMKKAAISNDALIIDPSPFLKQNFEPTIAPPVTKQNLHTLNGIKIPFSPGKVSKEAIIPNT